MSEWLKWSQIRLLVTLGISYILFAETASLLFSGSATCIVNPAEYGSYYADNNECPPFHVFLIKVGARILEILRDPNWVIAVFTIVLAGSTIGLWLSTNRLWNAGEKQFRQARRTAIIQSRDMQASTAAAQKSADTAEKAFTNLERPYIFIYGPSKFQVDPSDPDQWVFAKYQVANHGKTPAIIENVRAGIETTETGFPNPPIRVDEDHELFRVAIIPPGYMYSLPQHEAADVEFDLSGAFAHVQDLKGKEMFLWVVVNYRGAFTAGHETSACWRYDEGTDSLIQYGHGDYNYVR